MRPYRISPLATGLLVLTIFVGCATPASPTPEATPTEIILRNWEGDISQDILDAFHNETGITVTYLPYGSQEEAIEDIRAGEVYDVVVLENQLIPAVIADGLLAEIDYSNIPNFRNISANFRDLAYDPGNTHTVPYSWGVTGLAMRGDLVNEPITAWADLWVGDYEGQIVTWLIPRYLLGVSLKSLGYSLNSEDPAEIAEAADHLIELKSRMIMVEWESAVSVPYLTSGEAAVGMGGSDDVLVAAEQGLILDYILPSEGAILWGDNFVIPANSPNKEAAEQLINFLISAEISGQIMNDTYFWLPNDAAMEFVDPELRSNSAIFPPVEAIADAEIILPVSPAAEALYEQEWARFMEADQ